MKSSYRFKNKILVRTKGDIMAMTLGLTLLLLAVSAVSSDAVQFDVRRRSEKCLSDEVAQGSLVVVHYDVIGGVRGQSGVALSITDPLRKFLKQDTNIDTSSDDIHKFSFTADTGGSYAVCFVNNNDKPMRVMLDFKHGVEAKDYTEVAKREHLMPVEKELRKMEDTVEEIHREMLYMREREATMRNTNESTNSRVLWFSFFSIAVLLGMGIWQVMYLKKFFKSKKLI
ncbi:transmembrane emp24 domain-containing protein 10-like [Plasmopara halstedii]|uniref:Transmembrane emp24 domain-containing protein 10-like n=1 Tax=Plasmopara halstedii TaxID=4781 RepID=A0A0P1A6G9_PLAHL|nr:transmembrane emp24 domain-containing protein 10-like [Plasmopara halstedii]CEG35877.1 transmembrane emp24 domain-containing protein 10-like [Plasmopara halstedii]|eukprot:XP_024572246.1 transmembrane emp24 domain-containing protein 10-like [Plasmopara halstedii]